MLRFKIASTAIFIFALSIISTTAVQADYQNQVRFSKSETEQNDSVNTTSKTDFVGYSYFLDKVVTDKGPWAEAPFINRNAKININAFSHKTSTTKTKSLAISGTYSKSNSPLVISAHFRDSESDFSRSRTSDTTGYGIDLGYYVTKYTLISIERDKSKTEYSFLPETNNYDSTGTALSATTLILQGDTAISLSGSYTKTEHSDGDEFKHVLLTGTYYVNPRLGIGGLYVKSSDNFGLNNGKRVGITAQYFIKPTFSINSTISKYDSDDNQIRDYETISIGGTAYF
ncbi:MAG: hypothetical protein OEY52_15090 [Gammaproteobacteria bacterium]|nr:hypothetical protein [Gammaproteobacteria bacterium]